jgi:hypothetical protein
MREELLKIVYWKPKDAAADIPRPAAKDRVEAAKSVVMLDLALLNAEIANGLYKKDIQTLTKEIHYEPLSVKSERWLLRLGSGGRCCRVR